jgi:hypothetical protein
MTEHDPDPRDFATWRGYGFQEPPHPSCWPIAAVVVGAVALATCAVWRLFAGWMAGVP